MYNRDIEKVNFTIYQYDQLKNNGYNTIGDICSARKEDLILKLGKRAYYGVKMELRQMGLMFDFEIELYEKLKISLKQELEIPLAILDLQETFAGIIYKYFNEKYKKNTFNCNDIISLSIKELTITHKLKPAHTNELLFIIHKLGLKVKEEIKQDLEVEMPEYSRVFQKKAMQDKMKTNIQELGTILSDSSIKTLNMFGYRTIEDICNITYQEFVMQIEDRKMQFEILKMLQDFGLNLKTTTKQDDLDEQISLYMDKLEQINISIDAKKQKMIELKKLILEYEKQVEEELKQQRELNKLSQRAEELEYILNKGKK